MFSFSSIWALTRPVLLSLLHRGSWGSEAKWWEEQPRSLRVQENMRSGKSYKGVKDYREESKTGMETGGEQVGDGNTSCTYGNMKDAYHSQSLQLSRYQLHGYRTRVLIWNRTPSDMEGWNGTPEGPELIRVTEAVLIQPGHTSPTLFLAPSKLFFKTCGRDKDQVLKCWYHCLFWNIH